jgi:hypothetical protein
MIQRRIDAGAPVRFTRRRCAGSAKGPERRPRPVEAAVWLARASQGDAAVGRQEKRAGWHHEVVGFLPTDRSDDAKAEREKLAALIAET